MGTTYSLSFERIQLDDDQAGGRWTIRRTTPDTPPGSLGEFVTARPATDWDNPEPWNHHPIGDAYLAQVWATEYLYGLETRVTMWTAKKDLDTPYRRYTHTASTAKWAGQTEVMSRATRRGIIYHRGLDGSWSTTAGDRFRTLDDLHREAGPTVPYAVTSVPALYAELAVFRAVSGYVTGPDECMDAACSEFLQAEKDGAPLMAMCSHMTYRAASKYDTLRVDQVDGVLRSLESELGDLVDDPERADRDASERQRGMATAVRAIRFAFDMEGE